MARAALPRWTTVATRAAGETRRATPMPVLLRKPVARAASSRATAAAFRATTTTAARAATHARADTCASAVRASAPSGPSLCRGACVTVDGGDANNCGACGHGCLGSTCTSGLCDPVTLAPGGAGAPGTAAETVNGLTTDGSNVYWTYGRGSFGSGGDGVLSCSGVGCSLSPTALYTGNGQLLRRDGLRRRKAVLDRGRQVPVHRRHADERGHPDGDRDFPADRRPRHRRKRRLLGRFGHDDGEAGHPGLRSDCRASTSRTSPRRPRTSWAGRPSTGPIRASTRCGAARPAWSARAPRTCRPPRPTRRVSPWTARTCTGSTRAD